MKLRIIAILLLTTQSSYIFLNPHSPSSEYTNYLRMFHQYSRCLRTPTGISQCLFNPGCWTGDTHAIITTTIPPHPRQTSLMDHLRPGPRCGLKSSLSAAFLGTATHQSEVVYKIKTCFATVVQVQPSIFEERKAGPGGSITQRRTSSKARPAQNQGSELGSCEPTRGSAHGPRWVLPPEKALRGAFGGDPVHRMNSKDTV